MIHMYLVMVEWKFRIVNSLSVLQNVFYVTYILLHSTDLSRPNVIILLNHQIHMAWHGSTTEISKTGSRRNKSMYQCRCDLLCILSNIYLQTMIT